MKNHEGMHKPAANEEVPEVITASIRNLEGEKANEGALLQERLLKVQLDIADLANAYKESIERGAHAADESSRTMQTEIGRELHRQLKELEAEEEKIKSQMVSQLMDPGAYGLQ